MSSLDFTAEVWEALRGHIDQLERKDAADTLIELLIDHNYESAEIKAAFKGDKDVIGALTYYMDQNDDDIEEYTEDDDEDESEWD